MIVQTPEEYQAWVEENTFAQADSEQTVALKPSELSESEFLAPYAEEMGMSTEVLSQLHD
ncbi:MAG: hypothetical protein SWJ54_00615 [Cyanobacteriota bacterium]|nr:hypothetical protein [Cyanobacteriota bacterium]